MPETFRLTSSDGRYTANIRPDLGALLTSWQYQGLELLDCDLNNPDWASSFPSAVLYPFPNRTQGGQYMWQGKTFQLPQNETARGHALHGLVWNQPFHVLSSDAHQLICEFIYTGGEIGYPFSFVLTLHFHLSPEGLELRYELQNISSEQAPAAWGWHPYLKIGTASIDACELSLPTHEVIPVGTNMIPLTLTERMAQPASRFSLKDVVLDQVYQFAPEAPKVIALHHENGQIISRYSEDHTYFTLYTPPSRASIAIEPQTANINAFNNQEGLWSLAPHERRSGTIQLQFEEK